MCFCLDLIFKCVIINCMKMKIERITWKLDRKTQHAILSGKICQLIKIINFKIVLKIYWICIGLFTNTIYLKDCIAYNKIHCSTCISGILFSVTNSYDCTFIVGGEAIFLLFKKEEREEYCSQTCAKSHFLKRLSWKYRRIFWSPLIFQTPLWI